MASGWNQLPQALANARQGRGFALIEVWSVDLGLWSQAAAVRAADDAQFQQMLKGPGRQTWTAGSLSVCPLILVKPETLSVCVCVCLCLSISFPLSVSPTGKHTCTRKYTPTHDIAVCSRVKVVQMLCLRVSQSDEETVVDGYCVSDGGCSAV